MRRLILVFLLIYLPIHSQITITELQQNKRHFVQFGEIKLGFKIGLTNPFSNFEFNDSTKLYLMNENSVPKINLGIYSTIPLSEKNHFCLEIQRLNNRYNFTTGLDMDVLNNNFIDFDLEPLLSSNYTYSQISISSSIKSEVINNLFLGFGLTYSNLYNQQIDIESLIISYRGTSAGIASLSISPRIYAQYSINEKINIEINCLFQEIGQTRSYDEKFSIRNEYEEVHHYGYQYTDLLIYTTQKLQGNIMRKLSFSLIYLIKS